MALVAVGGERGNAARPEDGGDVQVVKLVGDGEGQHGVVGQRPAALDSGGFRSLAGLPEDTLADDVAVAVE